MAGPPGEGTEMPAHPESIEAVTGNDTNQMSVLRGFRGSSSHSSDVTEGSLVVDWPCGKPAGHSFQVLWRPHRAPLGPQKILHL